MSCTKIDNNNNNLFKFLKLENAFMMKFIDKWLIVKSYIKIGEHKNIGMFFPGMLPVGHFSLYSGILQRIFLELKFLFLFLEQGSSCCGRHSCPWWVRIQTTDSDSCSSHKATAEKTSSTSARISGTKTWKDIPGK